MRLELRDGQWAVLRDRIDHGADKRIKLARQRGKDDDEALVNIDDTIIREFVTAWHVMDPDGTVLALEDPTAIDRLPDDIADAIATRAAEIYIGATVPNPSTPS